MEFQYGIYQSFIKETTLEQGRLLHSDKASGPSSEIAALANAVGRGVSEFLATLATGPALTVRAEVKPDGSVALNPKSAWAFYYAFPHEPGGENRPRLGWDAWIFGAPSGTDETRGWSMSFGQRGWRIEGRGGSIPKRPFSRDIEASETYLEIRHEGYASGFIPMNGSQDGIYEVTLAPMLNKRVAVLDFTSVQPGEEFANISQLIVNEVISGMELEPQISPARHRGRWRMPSYDEMIERVHRDPDGHGTELNRRDWFAERGEAEQVAYPSVESTTEILNAEDVEALQKSLRAVDTPIVSGEGRHLRRKELDVNYIVKGRYRLVSGNSPTASIERSNDAGIERPD